MNRRTGLALILATLALSGALAPIAAPLASPDRGGSMSQPSNPLAPMQPAEASHESGPIVSWACNQPDPITVWFASPDEACQHGEANESALTGADAEETKVNIHASAATTAQHSNNTLTAIENRLTDARTIALMVGKNAAIREINNGSTVTQVEQAAQEAIEDYYAQQQMILHASFNTSAINAEHLSTVAENTSNVDDHFVSQAVLVDGGYTLDRAATYGSTEHTLVNGSTVTGMRIVDEDTNSLISTVRGNTTSSETQASGGLWINGVDSDGDSDDEPIHMVQSYRYGALWTEIQSEEDSVTTEVQNGFVANVYPEWEEGDINTTDLIDPYLCSRDYGPEENFQTWAACSLTSLGLNSPENMTNMGFMEVASGSQVYEGQLLSDGLPEGDAFEVGETYSADEIAGVQAVVTADETVQLEGEFTLLNATDADGNTFNESESIVYRNTTYETTNTEDYQDLMDDLSETRAGIEAWQQQLRSGGGGGLFGGAWPFGTIPTILIAGVVIALLTRG